MIVKRFIHLIGCLALVSCAGASLMSCRQDPMSGDEIVLGFPGELTADVSHTKTTVVESVPGTLYWGATTGSSGSETLKWNDHASSSPSVTSSGKIYTGKYQTYSPTSYNYYVSNYPFTVGSSCTMNVEDNSVDVVLGKVSSNSTAPSVTLGHIFARTGTLSIIPEDESYTVTDVVWTIASKDSGTGTAGTYNISSLGWTSATTALSEQEFTSFSNLYLIPGKYTVSCSYVLTKGDWSDSFSKSADVTLLGGNINNLSGFATGGDAEEIVISVSLTPWSASPQAVTLSDPPLTFEAVTAGTILWKKNGTVAAKTIQYRKNNGEWTDLTSTAEGAVINVNAGDRVEFRGSNSVYATGTSDYTCFAGTAQVQAYGNVNSLIDGGGAVLGNWTFCEFFYNYSNLYSHPSKKLVLPATSVGQSCYRNMFRGTGISRAPELPATTLAAYCYSQMFRDCTNLTLAPVLPATTMADRCYSYMFYGCTSLAAAPELPATTMADRCYNYMFRSCSSLVTPPALPATTLAQSCYAYMFALCTSLEFAPDLPATMLANSCYDDMFRGCTSLAVASELPARTLAPNCYMSMYDSCSSLAYAPELPATSLSNQCYRQMFASCTGLVEAPRLPATTLADYCYTDMFYGCTGLTACPELPATVLAPYCYTEMFRGCTGIVRAPELPAPSLVEGCYNQMFTSCSLLNYIKALFTTTPSNTYTENWVSGVAATGTFVKADGASWNVMGVHGVPSGWTVYTESTEP